MPQLLRIDIGGLTITQKTVIAPSYPLEFTRRSTSRTSRKMGKEEDHKGNCGAGG
jgi:hypothetical protein